MLRHRIRILGAFAFAGALAAHAHADGPPQVNVTITDKGCEPASLTVGAGKTVFLIRNASSRSIEWEILQGVMVVDERENIVPGFVQKLTTTLDSGSYGMTCGLLSNPKGTLNVTAKSGALEQHNGLTFGGRNG